MRVNSQTLEKDSIKNELTKFWERESLGTVDKDNSISKTFVEEIKFNGNNYVTKLPFKESTEWIPDNYQLCIKRLSSLKTRLHKDQNLLNNYNEIFTKYLENGIIEKVTSLGQPGLTTYLPHQPVIKPERDTTKIRIVFDGSAKSKGPSLNESLHTGPCLLTLIFDIILRFRMNPVALIGDIEQFL